jgi:hypothetical protein
VTVQVRCYKTANNGTTAVSSINPGYTGWTAVAPYANTAPVVGDLIVVVGLFTAGSGNVTQSGGTGSYTFITANGDANGATEPFTSWCAYRLYTAGDSSPAFAWSGTTTAYCYLIFALTSSLGGTVRFDANGTPKVDTTGATSHTPNTATAATPNDAAIVLNAARYQTSGSHAITMTTPCSGYSAVHIAGYNGTSGQYANSCSAYMDTPVGAGTITPGAEVFNEAVANNAYTLLVTEATVNSGPVLGWSSPAGIRGVLLRTGLAMASAIPSAAPVPPVIPATPFYARGSIRTRIVPPLRGRTASNAGAPVRNPGTGPANSKGYRPILRSRRILPPPRGRAYSSPAAAVKAAPPAPTPFYPAAQTVRARLPLQLRGRTYLNTGAPLRNPGPGPALYPAAVKPARAPVPQVFSKGRTGSHPGGPLRNPGTGPAFRQATQPVRARVPQNAPRGRMGALWGVPVTTVTPVTPFYPLTSPSGIRHGLPPRGRTGSNRGAPLHQPGTGPKFTQAAQPIRARVPQVFSKGRTSSSPGGPRLNPNAGPAFRQAAAPARIQPALPLRGRAGSNPGIPVAVPPKTAPFQARTFIRAQQPPARRGTCRAIIFLPLPSNPSPGPVFVQRTSPVQARFPLPPRGRTAGSQGGPVRNPPPGPVFHSRTAPARITPSLPPRGRIISGTGAPARNPATGPVFRQRVSLPLVQPLPRRGICRAIRFLSLVTPPPPPPVPVQAASPARVRVTLPPRGRISSSAGAPVRNPGAGPVFRQATQPARTRITLPPRGRTGSNPGTPPVSVPQAGISSGQPAGIRVIYLYTGRASSTARAVTPQNPGTGPAFRQVTQPVRARVTLPPRGRTGSNPGGPIPPPPIVAIFRQATQPARARVPQNIRGRVYSHPGAPLRNPGTGPVFQQATRPAQARQPLPPKGRIASNPGIPVAPPPAPAPFYPARTPARIRPTLPPRGRTGSNPGIPAPHAAPVYPLQRPVQARFPLPPRGRTASNPGGPVRNPHPGPVFRQAVRPARAVIPQNAPRGRTAGNPGGPVENVPNRPVEIETGSPFTGWETDVPFTGWDTATPYTGWLTGVPYA